jgi:glycosyltransferase involved in cell wall biosynthesis
VGFILSGIAEPEDDEVVKYFNELKKLEAKGTILTVDDMDHDTFMTLLKQCSLYLRTHLCDGVSSSVLEALAQRTPVIASDNGHRPSGVITYDAQSADDLQEKINYALNNLPAIKKKLIKPEIRDTVQDEMNLFMNNYQ